MKRLSYYIPIIILLVASCKTSKKIPPQPKVKKINMEIIKGMSYLQYASKIYCDSIETTLDHLVCANLALQRQDSILQSLNLEMINGFEARNDSISLSRFMTTKDLWENYRFAQCIESTMDNTRMDRIFFMECATKMTKSRIQLLKERNGLDNKKQDH